MDISGLSMNDVLASQLTNRSNNQVRNQIYMAVLKQTMDMEQQQAQAIVEMIQSMSVDGTGQLVNRTA